MQETLRHDHTPADYGAGAIRPLEVYLSRNAHSVIRNLLEIMCLAYSSGSELRKHIKNIRARYLFSFGDSNTFISLEIRNGGMRIRPGITELPDASIKFSDSGSVLNLLFSDKPDILGMILNQEVVTEGNLSYIYKLMYLVNHLQIKLLGPY